MKVFCNHFNSKWRFSASLFLLSISLNISAQQPLHQKLPLMDVNSITQDKDGYIWFSGQSGLIRYDGNELLSFNNYNESWSLPYRWTHNVSLINNGLLVPTEESLLHIFNTQTGENNKLPISISDNTVYNAIQFSESIYFQSYPSNNLYRYSPEKKHTELITNSTSQIRFAKAKNELYFWDEYSISIFKNNTFSKVLSTSIDCLISHDGALIIASGKQLHRVMNGRIEKTITLTATIKDMVESNDKSAVYLLDENNKILKIGSTLNKLNSPYSTKGLKSVRGIFHDKSDVLWLYGSQGVYILPPNNLENYERIFDTYINYLGVEIINEEVIIDSYGAGLQPLVQKENKRFKTINQQLTNRAKLINDTIRYNGNSLFVATFDGLWHFFPATNKIKRVNFENNNKLILKLRLDGNKLYMATDGDGFLIYDTVKKSLIAHYSLNIPFSSLEVLDILPINSNIWLANSKGIDILSQQTKQVKTLNLPGNSKVTALTFINNKIYAFTKGNGVYILNTSGELLSQLASGVNFNSSVLIEKNIYASSSDGLFKIDTRDDSFNIIEGTHHYDITRDAIKHNNDLFVGHTSGVLKIPLNNNFSFQAPIKISKTTINGELSIENNVIYASSAKDVITIKLASLDYRSNLNKNYQYKINDEHWLPIQGEQITLTGLASGTYDITIKGTNRLGQWSQHKAFTQIQVAYPWFWTTQMKILYIVVFTCLFTFICWLLYLRGRSINYIHQLLSTNKQLKNSNIKNVVRNLQHVLELTEQVDGSKRISSPQKHDQIKKILNQSIEELREQYKSPVDVPDNLNGQDLVTAIAYYAEFLNTKYHCQLTQKVDITYQDIPYEFQSDIYKVIYETTNSALLNGNGRHFHISIQNFKNKIWLTVQDNTDYLSAFNNRVKFDMAAYLVRQISHKYQASINAFEDANNSSQLIISFPQQVQ